MQNKVLFHVRFKDDDLIIFIRSETEILEFFELGNHCYPPLRFTFEISVDSMNFLDTTVYKEITFKNPKN